MRKSGGGSIISTASIAGILGQAGPLVYSVAKAGVIHLTNCAAVELAKDRIRVNCICPGGINTPSARTSTSRAARRRRCRYFRSHNRWRGQVLRRTSQGWRYTWRATMRNG